MQLLASYLSGAWSQGSGATTALVNPFNWAWDDIKAVMNNIVDGFNVIIRGYDAIPGIPWRIPEIPHFAAGTSDFPGGMGLVGEQGPELVMLPRGSQIYPAEQTRQILSTTTNNTSTSTRHITIQIYPQTFDLSQTVSQAEALGRMGF